MNFHMRKICKCFLLLCSPVNLSKQNIYAIFSRLKQFFSYFITPYLMHYSVILWNSPSCIQLELYMYTAYCNHSCNVLMFLLNTQKKLFYQKWNIILLAYLIWTCHQDVLLHNISLVVFVYICACAQIVLILIFSLLTGLYVTIVQISYIGIYAINNQPYCQTFIFILNCMGLSF